jgi:hypothetical protein
VPGHFRFEPPRLFRNLETAGPPSKASKTRTNEGLEMIYSPASEPAGHALRPIANGPTGQKEEACEGRKKDADEAGI